MTEEVNPSGVNPANPLKFAGESSKTISRKGFFGVHGSENIGVSLVSVQLTGKNYLTWSKAMKVALAAKRKLSFINGKISQPTEESDEFEDWCEANAIVVAWILSSLSKELYDSFVYHTIAKELWDKLQQRFGESNGPLRYQIKRDISSMVQGTDSIAIYFTKMSRLWDELESILPIPKCSCGCKCGAVKELELFNDSEKVLQFLLGLADPYSHVVNQITIMDPMPNIDKVYSMVLNVEKQKQIHSEMEVFPGNLALLVNESKGYKNFGNKNDSKKKEFDKKEDRYCTNCKMNGHTRDGCFKLIGYPDWYLDLKKGKSKQKNSYKANLVDNPFEEDEHTMDNQEMRNLMLEMSKLLKNQKSEHVNFAHDFAGPED